MRMADVVEHMPDPASVMKVPKPIPANMGRRTRLRDRFDARQMEHKIGYRIIRDAEPLHTEDMIPPARMATI